jgi:hypothetical protein
MPVRLAADDHQMPNPSIDSDRREDQRQHACIPLARLNTGPYTKIGIQTLLELKRQICLDAQLIPQQQFSVLALNLLKNTIHAAVHVIGGQVQRFPKRSNIPQV